MSHVGGGQRIEARHDVVVDGGRITRTRSGLVIDQLIPSAKNGHVRTSGASR